MLLQTDQIQLDTITERGWTALLLAASKGHSDVVLSLLHAGADINHSNKDGSTALQLAAKGGHFDTVALLIIYSADLQSSNHEGWTALQLAASEGFHQVVELLAQGIDVNALTRDGETALLIAGRHLRFANGRQDDHINFCETVLVLLKHGAGLEARNTQGESILHLAAKAVHVKLLNCIVHQHGMPTNALSTWRDGGGNTVVHTATEHGNTCFVGAVLDHIYRLQDIHAVAACVSTPNNAGRTAIELAIIDDSDPSLRLVKKLLARMPLGDIQSQDQQTLFSKTLKLLADQLPYQTNRAQSLRDIAIALVVHGADLDYNQYNIGPLQPLL
eukprot:TRINITY_DN11069_c0_g2_i2.p1 TRINITY_DN11069_c0_g2~~TRINITY_DN11069_c0_g2_i2.p1  ORF type:complete len:331 (+),score=44.92 TRINITY_DN11069_c0_g2_i2:461-1453(+)